MGGERMAKWLAGTKGLDRPRWGKSFPPWPGLAGLFLACRVPSPAIGPGSLRGRTISAQLNIADQRFC